jgi:hypothetical protein
MLPVQSPGQTETTTWIIAKIPRYASFIAIGFTGKSIWIIQFILKI